MATAKSITEHLNLGRVIAATALGLMAFGAAMAASKSRLEGAVQRNEFQDSAKAFRSALALHLADEVAHHASQDSVIRAGMSRIEKIALRQEDRDCAEKGYPLPWCADAARRQRDVSPAQAGSPR